MIIQLMLGFVALVAVVGLIMFIGVALHVLDTLALHLFGGTLS